MRHLPKIVRFQLMTSLALMWSIVFSVWAGMVTLAGPSMLVDLAPRVASDLKLGSVSN